MEEWGTADDVNATAIGTGQNEDKSDERQKKKKKRPAELAERMMRRMMRAAAVSHTRLTFRQSGDARRAAAVSGPTDHPDHRCRHEVDGWALARVRTAAAAPRCLDGGRSSLVSLWIEFFRLAKAVRDACCLERQPMSRAEEGGSRVVRVAVAGRRVSDGRVQRECLLSSVRAVCE